MLINLQEKMGLFHMRF